MESCDNKEQRLLRAKIAVVLQDEYDKVPTEQEIDQVYHLARILWKTVVGTHYQRMEQKKSGQLAIF
jgi:hypothetical protein